MNHGLTINHVEVSLLGEKTTRYRSGGKTTIRTDAFHETSCLLNEGAHVAGPGSLRAATQFVLPEDATPTTDGNGYPRITWSIKVHTDIPDGPDYRAKFPFRVEAGREATPTGRARLRTAGTTRRGG